MNLIKCFSTVFALSLITFFSPYSFAKDLRHLDESVSGLILHSPTSIQKKFGDSAWSQVKASKLPGGTASFFSKDKKQKLTMVFHPGGVKNSFSEFIVEYFKGNKAGKALEQTAFITSKGIYLGISDKELIGKLGSPSKKESIPGGSMFTYALSDMNHRFLKKHKMPSYYGKYTFADGKLIKFAFGFEYP